MNKQIVKPTILFLSDFPTREDPNRYMFIKHRTSVLRDHYNVVVVSTALSKHETSLSIDKVNGVEHILLRVNNNIPKIRAVVLEHYTKKLLEAVILDYSPTLIEIHFSSYKSWIATKLAKKYGLPSVIVEHASFFEDVIEQLYLGRKIKKGLRNADKIITVNSGLKRLLQKHVEKEVHVIPNIVSTKKFIISNETKKNPVPKIVSVGALKLNDIKGYFTLIDSLYILKNKGYPFHCTIVGEGKNKDSLLKKRNDLGLEKEIEFTGEVRNEELVGLYNRSNFFISTSKIETFGVAIVEAMSCGLPIVATKSGGPETYVDHQVGVLAGHSSEEIAEKVEYMLNNYMNYTSSTIRQKVINNFSEDKYLEKMNRIYLGLIKGI